jgi:hypothetical protein
MKRIFSLLLLFTLTLSACSPSAGDTAVSYPNPSYPNSGEDLSPPASDSFAPKPADSGLIRDNAFIESSQLLTLESYPLQFMLNLKVNMPTPCHELRIVVSPPDTENKINVDVYSITDPDIVCVQVLAPFEVNYPLGSFPSGTYSLWINGAKVADFQS